MGTQPSNKDEAVVLNRATNCLGSLGSHRWATAHRTQGQSWQETWDVHEESHFWTGQEQPGGYTVEAKKTEDQTGKQFGILDLFKVAILAWKGSSEKKGRIFKIILQFKSPQNGLSIL